MSLKPLVNDINLYKAFLEEMQTRINDAHLRMEQGADEKDWYRAQGEVYVLKSLMMLREKVNAGG